LHKTKHLFLGEAAILIDIELSEYKPEAAFIKWDFSESLEIVEAFLLVQGIALIGINNFPVRFDIVLKCSLDPHKSIRFCALEDSSDIIVNDQLLEIVIHVNQDLFLAINSDITVNFMK